MSERGQKICLAVALLALSLVVFWPAAAYEFLDFDDQDYVAANPYVQRGLTLEGLSWAFGSTHFNYWLPLTWLSYMAEREVHDGSAAAYHTTNILLHAANVLLLFYVLGRLTGNAWASAFCAALFAIHPLRIETVVWISDRKDLLNAFFWFLGLLTYLRYTEKRSLARYLLVMLCMAVGLLMKQTIVMLPAVLLLLDFWPLERLSAKAAFEKIPLLALAVGAGVATFLLHPNPGVSQGIKAFALQNRLLLIPINYLAYLRRFVWPAGLCPAYPFTIEASPVIAGFAVLVLLVLTLAFLHAARRAPAGIIGWMWFLVVLLPVCGLVRVGNSDTADRFTYVASIGLGIIAAWGIPPLLPGQLKKRWVLTTASGLLILVYSAATAIQMPHWKNSERLGLRAVTVEPDSFFAWNIRGRSQELNGDLQFAVSSYARALEIAPWFLQAHVNMGSVQAALGRMDTAIRHLRFAAENDPHNARTHSNLGSILFASGQRKEGLSYLRKAVELDPSVPDNHFNLGWGLYQSDAKQQALKHFLAAGRINPNDDLALFWAGTIMLEAGNPEAALTYFQRCAALKPDNRQYAAILRDVRSRIRSADNRSATPP